MIQLTSFRDGMPFAIKGNSIVLIEDHEARRVVFSLMPIMKPGLNGDPVLSTVIAPQEVKETIDEINQRIRAEQGEQRP